MIDKIEFTAKNLTSNVGVLLLLLNEMPLSLGLCIFQEANKTEWGALMAASLMMILPVIAAFFFLQKYFVQGISLTGLKG